MPQLPRQPSPAGHSGPTNENSPPTAGPSGSGLPGKKRTRNRRGNKPKGAPTNSRSNNFLKLELPEGDVPSSQRSAENSSSQTLSSWMTAREFRAVKPWALDPKYPRPTDNPELHSFNYDREWHSLEGKNVQEELMKALKRGGRAQLPPLFKDSSEDQLREAQNKYRMKGESQLYNIRLANRDAPESSNLFIASPLVPNEVTPTNDRLGLIQLLGDENLGPIIPRLLIPSIRDLTALAATCKSAASCIRASFEIWDFNSSIFPIENFAEKRDANGRFIQRGGIRSKTLVITPLLDRPAQAVRPYMTDFYNLMKLGNAMATIPWSFGSMVLDQIPFLDVPLLEIMINSMPNLTTLTVTRCILLDVTKLKPLLEVIRRHPRGVKGKETDSSANPSKNDAAGKVAPKYIRLDFFPFFFRGPRTSKRLGSYGVTYNEPTFHTPKAVFGLILQCWELAQQVGMDLVSDSSSFWSFVRQLPGPDVLWAVKARDALTARERRPAVGGMVKQLQDFADDITAALTGDDYKPGGIPWRMARYLEPDHHAVNYWLSNWRCKSCEFRYPGSLFPIRGEICWPCKMAKYAVEMESSHLRLYQISAMAHWREGLSPETATLSDLLEYRRGSLDKAIADASTADWIRRYFLRFQPKEDDARFSFVPPEPEGIDEKAASLARWRWWNRPATGPFDYREGGPQHEDPCKYEVLGDEPMNKANFDRQWRWTESTDRHYLQIVRLDSVPESRVEQELNRARNSPQERRKAREAEWAARNDRDKWHHMYHHGRVEDDLVSLFTPGSQPFNLDKPIVHKSVNPEGYKKFMEDAKSRYQPYSKSHWQYW